MDETVKEKQKDKHMKEVTGADSKKSGNTAKLKAGEISEEHTLTKSHLKETVTTKTVGTVGNIAESLGSKMNKDEEQSQIQKNIKKAETEQELLATEKHDLKFDCEVSPLEESDIESFRREPVDTLENECDEFSSIIDEECKIDSDEPDCRNAFPLTPKHVSAFCKVPSGSFKKELLYGEKSKNTASENTAEVSDNNFEAFDNSAKISETNPEAPDGIDEASGIGIEIAEIKDKVCDFCKGKAQFLCEYCTFFYCKSCRDRIHPALGPYLSHKVIPIAAWGNRIIRYRRCREHGLVAQLFCSYCEKNRCTECVKTKCSLHFKGKVSDADIEKEKTKLVEELDRATTRLGFLERYKEKVQHDISDIQMTGLWRREQVRQEFVSFHDLLIQKEAEMLQQLDQEVTERVNHVMDTLQASINSLEMEDANLTTTVMELVQSPNDARFIEEYVKAKVLCQEVEGKVREFDRGWAKDSVYTPCPVLDNNFSMLVEKRQLSQKLDGAMALPKLCFKKKTLLTGPKLIMISEYMEPPVVPPSTEVLYHMQLLQQGKLVYELKTKDLQNMKLNSVLTYVLDAGVSYLLRVTPEYCCHGQCRRRGTPSHMFIVVKLDHNDSISCRSSSRNSNRSSINNIFRFPKVMSEEQLENETLVAHDVT